MTLIYLAEKCNYNGISMQQDIKRHICHCQDLSRCLIAQLIEEDGIFQLILSLSFPRQKCVQGQKWWKLDNNFQTLTVMYPEQHSRFVCEVCVCV